jgi:hypothetical protein
MAKNNGLTLIMALSYGGRTEIVDAVRAVAEKVQQGILDPADINDQVVSQHLYTRNWPDPDLLIRTSGEMRISNFLLWQCSYSEFYVTPVLWPDFREPDFQVALTGEAFPVDFTPVRRGQRPPRDDLTQNPIDVRQFFNQGKVALELAMRARLIEAIDWLVATCTAHAALVTIGNDVRLRLTQSAGNYSACAGRVGPEGRMLRQAQHGVETSRGACRPHGFDTPSATQPAFACPPVEN